MTLPDIVAFVLVCLGAIFIVALAYGFGVQDGKAATLEMDIEERIARTNKLIRARLKVSDQARIIERLERRLHASRSAMKIARRASQAYVEPPKDKVGQVINDALAAMRRSDEAKANGLNGPRPTFDGALPKD